MAVGLNFGAKAANYLNKGAETSAVAMAAGGAAVGGVYEGTVGDGSMMGGAIMGAGLGSAAKVASNAYRIGSASHSANGQSFKFSNFTKGWDKMDGNRLDYGLATMRAKGANTDMNSARANATQPSPAPKSTSTPTSTASATAAPTPRAEPSAAQYNFGQDMSANRSSAIQDYKTNTRAAQDKKAKERLSASRQRQRERNRTRNFNQETSNIRSGNDARRGIVQDSTASGPTAFDSRPSFGPNRPTKLQQRSMDRQEAIRQKPWPPQAEGINTAWPPAPPNVDLTWPPNIG